MITSQFSRQLGIFLFEVYFSKMKLPLFQQSLGINIHKVIADPTSVYKAHYPSS